MQRVDNQITEGVIWKTLLKFFFPILLGTFFQQMYNMVDAVVVGRFVGSEALAAVGGTTGTLINLLVGFFTGLASGVTVIIAQFYGARDHEGVSKSVHTSAALCVMGGIAMMALGFGFAKIGLELLDTPAEVVPYSLEYMYIYFAGVIFPLIYNVGTGILRAVGDSKRPMIYLIVCCVVNIVLDLVFVVWFRLEVIGVALATLISQIISALLVIRRLVSTQDCYRLMFKKITIHKDLLGKTLRLGLPSGVQSMMYSLSNLCVQAGINSFGTTVIAANTAFSKVDGLFWMVMGALGISITTFVGQNFGARKDERIREGVRTCLVMAAIACVLFAAIVYAGRDYIFRLFTKDDAVVDACKYLMNYIVPFYLPWIAVEAFSGAMRGVGDVFLPMVFTCFGICGLRILWILVVLPLWRDFGGLMLVYPVTWLVTGGAFTIYYLRFNWLKKRQLMR